MRITSDIFGNDNYMKFVQDYSNKPAGFLAKITPTKSCFSSKKISIFVMLSVLSLLS